MLKKSIIPISFSVSRHISQQLAISYSYICANAAMGVLFLASYAMTGVPLTTQDDSGSL